MGAFAAPLRSGPVGPAHGEGPTVRCLAHDSCDNMKQRNDMK
jgi:hypothetical protein